MLATVETIEIRTPSGGDDHDLRQEGGNLVGLQLRIQSYIDTKILQFGDAPVDDTDQVLAPAFLRREEDLPAKPRPGLVEYHRMTALSENARRFQPSRATAHDDRPLRAGSLFDLMGQSGLSTAGRVMNADRCVLPATGCADAWPDPDFLSGHQLADQVRVCKMCSRHAHHVQQPFTDRVARSRKIGDSSRVEDRLRDLRLERSDSRKPGTQW